MQGVQERYPRQTVIRMFNNNQEVRDIYDPSQDLYLILTSEISVPSSSTFAPLMNTQDSPLLDIATVVAGLSQSALDSGKIKSKLVEAVAQLGSVASGKYKEFGYQIWKGTDPLNIVLNASLYATWDAQVQVTKPSQYLQKLPLPGTQKEDSSVLVPPGPVITDVINSFMGKGGKDQSTYVFTVAIGNLVFENVYVKEVTATYSDEKMYVDGYRLPMRADLTISLVSTYTATKADIDTLWSLTANNTIQL